MSAPAASASSALSPLANTAYANGLAGTVRQVGRAADHLVGVARVNPKIERQLDRFVELCRRTALDRPHGIRQRVELHSVDGGQRRLELLALLRHRLYPTTSRPIERAEPTIIWVAASML